MRTCDRSLAYKTIAILNVTCGEYARVVIVSPVFVPIRTVSCPKQSMTTRYGKPLDLATMLDYLPELRTLRQFVDTIHRWFATDQSTHQAWCRLHALQNRTPYRATPELAEVLE